jgi:hypothetical protein
MVRKCYQLRIACTKILRVNGLTRLRSVAKASVSVYLTVHHIVRNKHKH